MHTRIRRLRGSRACGAALLVAALFCLGWGWWSSQPVNIHSQRVQYFKVARGESASAIGAALKRQGLIRSGLLFRLVSRLRGSARALQSGVYRISPRESLRDVLSAMQAGHTVVIRVTIPEGFTVKQIIARLVAHHIGTLSQYRALMRHPLATMPLPAKGVLDPWEGYLLPKTYAFAWGTTPAAAISLMWATFRSQALPLYQARSRSLKKFTLSQWVTLASVVQAEDKLPQDAPKVAAVFTNRLHRHMPLQSDATVRYALHGKAGASLSYADLATPSPYNTYRVRGLPPGPIDNPSLAMLKAAAHPAHVPYRYFLGLPNGRNVFAVTYAQQLANMAKVGHQAPKNKSPH